MGSVGERREVGRPHLSTTNVHQNCNQSEMVILMEWEKKRRRERNTKCP